MSELEEKLGAMLKDPQLMQQIQSMAQSLGVSQETASQTQNRPPQDSTPDIDPRMLQGILGMLRQGSVDHNQQALLHALSPYLSQERVSKLERAMRTARIAGAASSFLNAGALKLLSGR